MFRPRWWRASHIAPGHGDRPASYLDGSLERCKARLVAGGYGHDHGFLLPQMASLSPLRSIEDLFARPALPGESTADFYGSQSPPPSF